MSSLRVTVTDDYEIVRFGISTLLESSDDISVVGEGRSGEECLSIYKELNPDVAVVDIKMPEMDGIETTRKLLEIDPDAKVMILTAHVEESYLQKVLSAGALGYVLKSSSKDELITGVKYVATGRQVFSEPVSKIMANRLIEKENGNTYADQLELLTEREKEIMVLIAEGLTSHEIAEKLFISPRTVETHRSNLMHKLELKNTASLVRFAITSGLVAIDSKG